MLVDAEPEDLEIASTAMQGHWEGDFYVRPSVNQAPFITPEGIPNE